MAGIVFFPRGGSAFVARELARGLVDRGADLRLVAGSRHDDPRGMGDARAFYDGVDLREVDFTAALAAADPVTFDGPPLPPSFEDREGAPDRVFASLDDAAYALQARAWADALRAAGAAEADVLHLHHLTPLNAAAQEAAPDVPVVAHLHGTELLMLEAIAAGAAWPHGVAWAERLRGWAARAALLIVAPGGGARAARLLGVATERFEPLPNGFDPELFHPRRVDRLAVWRRVLVEQPRGWLPGAEPGSVGYAEAAVEALCRGSVIVFVGRFTEVKGLPVLLEAFAAARPRFDAPASLVLVGGHPGEWEGEHPAEAIERLGLDGVLLAGWHEQSELPELLAAGDALVLPSERESFGQVIVEAMASGVPAIATASLGPRHIVDDGETGWLVPVGDRDALAAALVGAVNDPAERRRRGKRAEQAARERFAWPVIAERLEGILSAAARQGGRGERARVESD
jgi:glycosyltransferase involved in cell wall biosynthesis